MPVLKVIISVFVLAFCLDLSNSSNDNSFSNGNGHGLLPDVGEWEDDGDFYFGVGFEQHPHFRTMSGFINFAIIKGCDFLMGFVKNMYYHDTSRKRSTECDWRRFVDRSCLAHHVPKELCCALINCGVSHSLVAIGASRDVIDKCNVTSVAQMMGSASLSEKRAGVNVEPLTQAHDPHGMCDQSSQSLHVNVFGKRNAPDATAPLYSSLIHSTPQLVNVNQTLNSSLDSHAIQLALSSPRLFQALMKTLSNLSHSGVMPSQAPIRGGMRHWCKGFSRSINKRYHFKEVKFISRSLYWIVDVYKTAHEHHVPTNYTHGLVGCGMTYAMDAFNADQWQTFLYNLVL